MLTILLIIIPMSRDFDWVARDFDKISLLWTTGRNSGARVNIALNRQRLTAPSFGKV